MIKAAYEQIVEKIAKQSGLDKQQIERRVEAKRAKLSGLITKEGAAQIVAAELGISFDRQKVKVSELLSGMRKVSVTGKIVELYPIRGFKKGEKEGKVATFLLADETASVRTVLWDTKHIKLVEDGEISKSSVIEIKDASVRDGELHLSGISALNPSKESIDAVNIAEVMQEKSIAEIKPNDRARVRATMMQIFEPRFFAVCPECFVKLTQEENRFLCSKHSNVVPKYRVILTAIVDDGTENMRAVFFSDAVSKLLGISEAEADSLKEPAFFLQKKDALLGSELWLSGRARTNKLFGNLEFIVSDVSEVNVEELIEKFSK
jgi:rRNA maturation endonuclease Nob1